MAGGALLEFRVQQVMRGRLQVDARIACAETAAVVALQAERRRHGAPQQSGVHGPVRGMACLAAFHGHRSMFVDEGPPLVHVAFQTGLFVQQPRLHHARPVRHAGLRRKSAVRIVAIGALHESLVHAVPRGHFELCPDIRMATVAQIGLFLRQQKLGSGGMVHRVATGARYVVQGVLAPPDIGLVEIACVARQAGFHDRLGLHQGKGSRDGGLTAARRHVCRARTVAPLATRPLGSFLAGRDALVVRVLVEVEPHVGMARLAYIAAHVAGLRRLCRGGTGQQHQQ